MIQKQKILKGTKVLVKSRSYNCDNWVIKEGIIIDSLRDTVLIQFLIFSFGPIKIRKKKWFDLNKTQYQEIIYKTLENKEET